MTHSFVRDSDVIGRDGDKQKILDLLMHSGDYGNVSVIAICYSGNWGYGQNHTCSMGVQ